MTNTEIELAAMNTNYQALMQEHKALKVELAKILHDARIPLTDNGRMRPMLDRLKDLRAKLKE